MLLPGFLPPPSGPEMASIFCNKYTCPFCSKLNMISILGVVPHPGAYNSGIYQGAPNLPSQLSLKDYFLNSLWLGFEQDSAGFEQGSANYLGLNRILQGSWPHGPPSLE